MPEMHYKEFNCRIGVVDGLWPMSATCALIRIVKNTSCFHRVMDHIALSFDEVTHLLQINSMSLGEYCREIIEMG